MLCCIKLVKFRLNFFPPEEQPIYANAADLAKPGDKMADKMADTNASSPDSDTSATTTPTPSTTGQSQVWEWGVRSLRCRHGGCDRLGLPLSLY